MNTLCKAIDDGRMELVIGFALYLREACDFSQQAVHAVFAAPHKWEAEFKEWQESK